MKIEERKYKDGREFESENGCKDWEEEEYKKYILIKFDKTEKFYTSYY